MLLKQYLKSNILISPSGINQIIYCSKVNFLNELYKRLETNVYPLRGMIIMITNIIYNNWSPTAKR